MRITPQRAKVIDYLRAFGGMSFEEMHARYGGDKRNLKRVIRGLSKRDCVRMDGGKLSLLPAGYIAVGSFPAKARA